MEQRRVFMVLMILTWMSCVSFDLCLCSVNDHANENSGSLADWSSEKFAKGFGEEGEKKTTPDHDVIGTVDEEQSTYEATESINSEVPLMAGEEAKEIGTSNDDSTAAIPRKMEYPSRHNDQNGDTNTIDDNDDKARSSDGSISYEQAHRKFQEACELVKEYKLAEEIADKRAYEAAKENLSQATGDFGAAIRSEGSEEL